MLAVNYTHARNNLKSLIDTVCNDDEEVIITTKNDRSVIMLSLDAYNRTHAQIKHSLQQSLEEIEHGEVIPADEAFRRARESYR